MRCGGGPHNLEDPPAHLWSGHSALIGRVPNTLVDVVPALQGFGETLEESRKACLEQLRLVANARWIDAGVRKRPVWKKVSNNDQLLSQLDAPRPGHRFVLVFFLNHWNGHLLDGKIAVPHPSSVGAQPTAHPLEEDTGVTHRILRFSVLAVKTA